MAVIGSSILTALTVEGRGTSMDNTDGMDNTDAMLATGRAARIAPHNLVS